MWGTAEFVDVWKRRDPFTSESLLSRPNVGAWAASTQERGDGFEALVVAAQRDISAWGATPLGVFSCGYGGVSVALDLPGPDRRQRQGVGKWVAERDRVAAIAEGSQVLCEMGIGPAVLNVSDAGLLLERVVPGLPLRTLSPSLDGLRAAMETLAKLRGTPARRRGEVRHLLSPPLVEVSDWVTEAGRTSFDAGLSDHYALAVTCLYEAVELVDAQIEGFGHGDYQSGNVLLASGAGLGGPMAVVDVVGTTDNGLVDAARFTTAWLVDAHMLGISLGIDAAIVLAAGQVGLDESELAKMCRLISGITGFHVRRTGPDRVSEYEGYSQLLRALS